MIGVAAILNPTTVTNNAGIDMGNSVLSNISTPPTAGTEGASKQYVDDTIGFATAENLGSGKSIFAQKTGNDLQFKTLQGNVNLTLGGDQTRVTIGKELFLNPFPQYNPDTTTITGLAGTQKWTSSVLAHDGRYMHVLIITRQC